MTNETETLTSGIDPASFSSVIKPTNDLFRYVNGPWIDTYRLPDDRSRYGSFDKLAEDAENQVRDILDADDCPAVKSEALYRSFLNTDAIEAAGLDPIRDELDLIDSAIDKAALTRVLGTINPAGGPDLFGLAVYGDPGDPDRNIAHLEQAGLCLPDEAYYREDHYAPVREAYVAMVATQLVNAGYAPAAESNGGDELPSNTGDDESNAPATVPSEAALGMARHFLAVETKIAANHWDNVATRDSVKTYNPTDYADLAATLKNFDLGSWIDAWQTAYDATEAAKAQPIDFKSVFARVIVHEPSMNVIVFPAAILQPPFFDPKAEDAANYGGIGAVIGHEIGHGFDDQGSQYDGDGKLNNWWTDEDRKNFEARTGALIAQYNSFVPLQLAEKYADEPDKAPHVNGALTIGENIGDLGGVNIALKAYAFALGKAAGKSDAKEDGSPAAIKALLDTAPEMDGFTGLQRFFLSYASIWRTKNRDELAEQYLQIDPHSPAEFRTNGIASNVDLFYDAFGVTEGDAMWLAPKDRVSIW